jgi:hypothetical protein
LVHAKSVLPDPYLFLLTGDSARHGVHDKASLRDCVGSTLDMLRQYYKGKKVTTLIGNNDLRRLYILEATLYYHRTD